MNEKWTHLDEHGNAIMVDVSDKQETKRVAVARGTIQVNKTIYDKIKEKEITKGDVLSVARIAGIMAAKKTSELIPLCHPLMLTKCTVDFEFLEESYSIVAICKVKVTGTTGVEMEALTGASIALLTIYDMCKALDKGMKITQVELISKTGGKSGDYEVPAYDR